MIWQPSDMTDRHALDIHARVERWALDEVALPGKLVHQIVDWLYREDRFCRGALTVRKTLLGPLSLPIPTLAVVNTADEVAPLASVAPFTDAMPTGYASIIEYQGEVGVGVQHLGVLVGREAHARVSAANHFLAQCAQLISPAALDDESVREVPPGRTPA